ncbi:hypothetical protein JCM10212_003565 [Sporobolomyces blumeae]
MASSASDTSEPVMVSHPSSPRAPPITSSSSAASLAPAPVTIKDTASEQITALSPSEPDNTTTGLNRAQFDRLARRGPADEAVIGPAHGEAPEYVATLKHTTSIGEQDDRDDDTDGVSTRGPKWFKKVKDGVSQIKEKAASSAGSIRERADSGNSGQSAPAAMTTQDRSNTKSSLRLDLSPPDRIIVDQHGTPVPLGPSSSSTEEDPHRTAFDRAVKQDDFAKPVRNVGGASITDSTTTSVKEKVRESFDVEPRTSQEKFHTLFKQLASDEELIEDYRCALVRDVHITGKLYLSEHYLSFRSAILGWETNLQIPWSEIVSIEKRMTAKVIPNAIEVNTLHASHTFASFLARDAAFKLIASIWRHVHPGEDLSRDESDASTAPFVDEPEPIKEKDAEVKSQISFEDEKGQKKSHRFKSSIAAIRDHMRSSSSSTGQKSPTEAEKVKHQAQSNQAGGGPAPVEYDGPEYKNEALDCVLPTDPDKAYELFFANESFLRTFLEGKEGLSEVDIGVWHAVDPTAAAEDDDHALKERDMSYVKPLHAPVGPKQTHCFIHDKNDRMDPDTWISNVTVTKTPDVPSGDNFSTVTRSVFTRAPGGGTHVRVTTEVEWTKVNRMLRGVIERGAIDGQKTYHKDLEEAVRAHIEANKAEYAVEMSDTPPAPSKPKAAQISSSGSSDSGSFLDSLPVSPTILLFGLVVVLALTNFFTLLSLRHQAALARQARIGHPSEVASAVSRVLGDFNSLHERRVVGPSGGGVAGEVEQLKHVLATLEKHVVQVADQVPHIVRQIRELADRMEGVRGML